METLKVVTAARLAPSDLAAAVIAPLIGLPGSSPHTTAFFNRRFERLDPCRERQARSEEHTSELQSLMRISYAVFCLKKKNKTNYNRKNTTIMHTLILQLL